MGYTFIGRNGLRMDIPHGHDGAMLVRGIMQNNRGLGVVQREDGSSVWMPSHNGPAEVLSTNEIELARMKMLEREREEAMRLKQQAANAVSASVAEPKVVDAVVEQKAEAADYGMVKRKRGRPPKKKVEEAKV